LRKAILYKSYEFNCHGVELNQRYVSGAVAPDGSPEAEWRRDRELYYQATTRPGAKLPHVWLERDGVKVSTLDIVGKGRFTLLTGIAGEDIWREAAATTASDLGVPLEAIVIGPGRAYHDLYGDWADAREVPESGCLLVRPDGYVAWRAFSGEDAAKRLTAAHSAILHGTAGAA